jgi:6-phosphogluconolactonase/glucosamine-6-phosphate isomerase/deaminase
MQFVKAPREDLEAALAEELKTALSKGSVVWLLPGGSNIPSVAAVMEHMAGHNNSELTLFLGDERYGPIDHADSYLHQIKQTGLNLHGASLVPVLTGSSAEDTIAYYDKTAARLLTDAKTVIAFLGIGSSGLIAGIIPGTPSVYAFKEWAISYELQGAIRLTLTPFALSHVDIAVVGAYGSEKGPILRSLAEDSTSTSEQPCQLLKHIPKVIIYNDQIDAKV